MDDHAPHPGMVISDRYRLEEPIGEGAFSLVFRATDLKDGSGVALKLLSPEAVNAAGFDRFRREAELASQLRHPNTVRLIAFNLRIRPHPFIVYELLEGEPLAKSMSREGPLGEARSAAIAMQVAKSLLEAHERGIVHRDIKPENVFLTQAGDVKVLDFGIAKSVEVGEGLVTQAGILVGTPRYMPPEQIRGSTPVPAMDVYALGVMLAEMLSGRPVLECSAAEACLEQLRPERIPLPAELERSKLWPVLCRATEKDLDARYATVNELLGALEHAYASLSPAPLVERPREERVRISWVPTTVMENPEHAPPAGATAPPRGTRQPFGWVAATLALLVFAIVATAFAVYWLRTQ
ncbi:MAG: serine/threonine-protein kinase [Polyangiaceae bacterium]